jgi:hypothetical protein
MKKKASRGLALVSYIMVFRNWPVAVGVYLYIIARSISANTIEEGVESLRSGKDEAVLNKVHFQPIVIFSIKFCLRNMRPFLLTLRSNADKTAIKTKKTFFYKWVLELNVAPIKGLPSLQSPFDDIFGMFTSCIFICPEFLPESLVVGTGGKE